MVYLSPGGSANIPEAIPQLTSARLHLLQGDVGALAASLHSRAFVPLDAAAAIGMPVLPEYQSDGRLTTVLGEPQSSPGGRHGFAVVAQLYVATPALLRFYRIGPAAIRPGTDIVTARSGLTGVKIMDFSAIAAGCKAVKGNCTRSGLRPGYHAGGTTPGRRDLANPAIQVTSLPHYTSAPNSLLTAHAMKVLGLQALLAGWLIQVPAALTAAQVSRADHLAAANGLTVETATGSPQASLALVSDNATAVGVLAVLTVLAMTIGLIRSETANDLRVLSATGASGRTRRLLTAATAAALAFLGALVGTAAAYLGIIAWNRGVHSLASVPVAKLAVLIVGVPLVALTAGWLLAGREPRATARQPLD
jgi:putative ABC transport system permease protein